MIANVNINGYLFKCIVLITDEEKRIGLANITKLNDNEGALFYFNPPQFVCFWMKGCLIPLDLIIIDKNLRIIDIYEMEVDGGKRIYNSSDESSFALEVPMGVCKKYNINIGDLVKIDIEW